MRRHHFLLVLTCLAGSSITALAQDSRYEAGIAAGGLIYQGDLTPSPAGSYRTMRPQFSAWIAKNFSNTFSIRGTVMTGGLRGDDALFEKPVWRKERALSFKASITEFSALGVWDVSGGRSALAPYVFAGVGYVLTNIERDASHFNHPYFVNDKAAAGLEVDLTRMPPKGFAVVPVGIGLRYALSERISLITETNYRLSHTDYLDGFSQAGNPKLYDHYQSYLVGITWRFDGLNIGGGGSGASNRKSRRSQGCPVIR